MGDMKSVLILCVLVFGNALYVESVLRTSFIEDLCYNTQHTVYDLKYETSGILMSAPKLNPNDPFECEIVFTPPRGASVVISIYRYDLSTDDVLIIEDSDRHRVALMGYGVFKDEKKSVISEGKMRVYYKTGNKTNVHTRAGFQFTFTKVMKSPCSSNEFKCGNGHCVLKEYICDGHNHCGDLSGQKKCDSTRLDTRTEPPYTPHNYGNAVAVWVSLISIAVLIVGSVIVITVIVVLVRRAKRKKAQSSNNNNSNTPQVAGNSIPLQATSPLPQQTAPARSLQSVSATVPYHNSPVDVVPHQHSPVDVPVHDAQDNSLYNRVRRSLRGARTQPRVENVRREQNAAPERHQMPSMYPNLENNVAPERHQVPSMYPSLEQNVAAERHHQVPSMYPSRDQIPSAPEMHGVENPEFNAEE